ncbi:hypothetical protein C1H46_032858 [Malus baccata]|uniref:Uncharacterized protein n=1 Tax=Malus baccata TaxID=106549 RepID=A0A540L573_MALBA|nr:hypothetical protein C1H46_032858 [Malus baccata]
MLVFLPLPLMVRVQHAHFYPFVRSRLVFLKFGVRSVDEFPICMTQEFFTVEEEEEEEEEEKGKSTHENRKEKKEERKERSPTARFECDGQDNLVGRSEGHIS